MIKTPKPKTLIAAGSGLMVAGIATAGAVILFEGRTPHTQDPLSPAGRAACVTFWETPNLTNFKTLQTQLGKEQGHELLTLTKSDGSVATWQTIADANGNSKSFGNVFGKEEAQLKLNGAKEPQVIQQDGTVGGKPTIRVGGLMAWDNVGYNKMRLVEPFTKSGGTTGKVITGKLGYNADGSREGVITINSACNVVTFDSVVHLGGIGAPVKQSVATSYGPQPPVITLPESAK